MRTTPADSGILNLLGVTLATAGRPAEAVGHLRAAVDAQPNFADAWQNLGIVLQGLERYADAAVAFRTVLTLRPDLLNAASRLGTCLQQGGDLDQAIAQLRAVLAQAPLVAENHFALAAALHSNGDLEEGCAGYMRGLELAPDNVHLAGLTGRALLCWGKVDTAEKVFAHALARAPEDKQALQGMERCGLHRSVTADSRNPALPEGLIVRGSLSGPSGYAHMSRHFLKHLLEQKITLRTLGLYGREGWQPPGESEADRFFDTPVRAKGVLNFLIPALVEPIAGTRSVCFSMFEGTRVPGYWVRFNLNHDLVIVPTESSRLAWADSGYPEDRLRVCPLGVDIGVDPAGVAPLALAGPNGRPLSSYRTRILNVSDFIPRKNIDGLLRTWLRTTRPDDDAVLVIKAGKGSASQSRAMQEIVHKTEQAVGKTLAQAAPVLIANVHLTDGQMQGLVRACTHYWSMSHGEGWDLPMTQAGAFDLQLIAPDHSAYQAYLDDSVATLIPSDTGPAFEPYTQTPWTPFFGLEWWRPDEDAAADILRAIIDGRAPVRQGARERLRSQFSWEQATRTLTDILRDTGAL